MKYLLDTNSCIQLLNDTHIEVKNRFLSENPEDIKLCSIVKAELEYGARHSQKVEANRQRLKNFYIALESLPFDDKSAEQYGILRQQLRKNGTPIGANDMLIAAIALANHLTLVTHNTKEFNRIEQLAIEDWELL